MANLEIQKKEMCMEPLEPGPCTENIERYYFDEDMGKCMSFKFGGCHGNRNNFESKEECETTCHSLIESVETAKPKEIDMGNIDLTEKAFSSPPESEYLFVYYNRTETNLFPR